MSKHLDIDIRVPVEPTNLAIKRIESLCIKCGQCKEVCKKDISVGHHYDLLKTDDTAICIHCGQCVNVCPTGSLVEVQDWLKVRDVIQEGKKKVVVITSPSVRVGLGEEFGMDPGSYVEEEMVGCLRALGVDYVFDTTFAADLTIMEEASELIDRVVNKKPLPQFTSCCPAWVKFVETYYPALLPNISSSKSPISMFAPTIKTWFAKKENIDPKDIYVVALTPCTAKKFEIKRDEFHDASEYQADKSYPDCDQVITTKELANWIRGENLDFTQLNKSEYDTLLPRGSGAGIIFGNTGGVMEAAIRTAYYLLTKQEPQEDLLQLEAVRGMSGVKTASLTIADIPLKVAVIHGTDNARNFISHIQKSGEHFDFVEVMTCRGGCIGGGGQPKHINEDMDSIRKQRIASLYEKDSSMKLRNSHDNPTIKQVYEEFYGTPLSEISEKLLHTTYHIRDDLHENPEVYAEMFQELNEVKETAQQTGIKYRCSVCGYIYEGDISTESDDYKCPICGLGKEMFEIMDTIEQPTPISYKCSICGYIYEGDIKKESDAYMCPICEVGKHLFEKIVD